jgi:hypothetical protein
VFPCRKKYNNIVKHEIKKQKKCSAKRFFSFDVFVVYIVIKNVVKILHIIIFLLLPRIESKRFLIIVVTMMIMITISPPTRVCVVCVIRGN